MNDTKTAAIHTDITKLRPVLLGEYRAAQEASSKRLDKVITILQELKATC